ncbi:Protein-glutamate O-methyltransferase [Venturia inaequalis]|nr:Protein-glutamate O-methyltransferase [Venturia inaequalis]
MTSFERQGLDTYNNAVKPQYGILTYTWGRWRSDSVLALPVSGVTWRIPAVKESHFTVQAFHSVLERICHEELDWAWIDIACIDQENGEVKMDEIGRQASIFGNAAKVFVWLSSLETGVLTSALDDIGEYGPQLMTFDSLKLNRTKSIGHLYEAFEVIFNDPWFSSLWTLQEIVLRHDAMIISREGQSIPMKNQGKRLDTFMSMLKNSCQNIHGDLLDWNASGETEGQISTILRHINCAGFYFLHSGNPNVQYGIAKYRQTEFPLDRVYGIMQVYNLRVGEAARPGARLTLEELEDEFAGTINSTSPVLGQLFVHSTRPPTGKSWRITQNSTVPYQLLSYNYKDTKQLCSIAVDGAGRATAKGDITPLLGLLEPLMLGRNHMGEMRNQVGLYLDSHINDDLPKDLSPIPQPFKLAGRDWYTRCKVLSDRFGRELLWILKLGVHEEVATKSKPQGWVEDTFYRLVLHGPLPGMTGTGESYERVGVVTWVIRWERSRDIVKSLRWDFVDLILL